MFSGNPYNPFVAGNGGVDFGKQNEFVVTIGLCQHHAIGAAD